MIPAAPVLKGFHIPSLDGLRAVSILVVFLSHAGLHRFVPGLFGVTVFFFLSGYLITTLMRMECEQTGGLHLTGFFGRRALRILPPFYLTLGAIVVLALAGLLPGDFRWGAVFGQAAHLANYQEILGDGGAAAGTEIFWSLAVEEHFYLLFPLVYLGLRRWLPKARHQFLALAVLAGAVLAWRLALVHLLEAIPLDPRVSHHPRICHATDTRFDSLLFGCMLAVYGNPVLDRTRFPRRIWLGIGLPLALGALALSFALRGPAFRETWRYTLQGAALFPLFIAAIRYADWGIFRVLNHRWLRFLGVLSYPIYLTHAALIAALQYWMPITAQATGRERVVQGILVGGLAFVLSVGTAWLMHHFVEKPCARWRRKLSRVRSPQAPQTPQSGSACVERPKVGSCPELRSPKDREAPRGSIAVSNPGDRAPAPR